MAPDTAPIFPVVVKYVDWEMSTFADEREFFEASGCEEVGFTDALVIILDSLGRTFSFDQESRAFVPTSDQPDVANLVRQSLRAHLHRLEPAGIAEALRLFDAETDWPSRMRVVTAAVLRTRSW